MEKKDIYVYANGTALTSRPLKNDELFEVILDRKGSKFDYGFGIGVLTVRPEDFEFPIETSDSPHVRIYQQSALNDLPAGTTFGVMRKPSDGDVHFYINGDDKGSAKLGIYGPIYGVVQLRGDAEKITILNP